MQEYLKNKEQEQHKDEKKKKKTKKNNKKHKEQSVVVLEYKNPLSCLPFENKHQPFELDE
jgi:hypothetical protein